MDLERIRELIELLIEKDVAEFELEQEGMKVRIRRMDGRLTELRVSEGSAGRSPATGPATTAEAPAEEALPAVEQFRDCYIVTSPMVGTFYRAPEPGADAFVEVGDRVEEGQTLCIIEAMKLMNEIASEIAGEVVAIFVENAEPVEYGQQLFAIRPVS